jgi:hypothetical protein
MVRMKDDDADETNARTEHPLEARKRLAIMMEGTDRLASLRVTHWLPFGFECWHKVSWTIPSCWVTVVVTDFLTFDTRYCA